MRGELRVLVAMVLIGGLGCDSKVDGLKPVGGDEPSSVEQERYLGRLHLDLIGARASDAWIEERLAQLAADGDTPATRAAIADPLINSSDWAELYVAELENSIFGGQDADARYQQLCGNLRALDPTCTACPPPSNGDSCDQCSCAPLTEIVADRGAVRAAATNLADGDTTSEVGRVMAAARAFTDLQDPDTTVAALFETFVGRPPEPEERRSGRNMVFGITLPSSPAGLLFHRHGANYQDLIDIVFESEVYREAQVAAVFDRYLGRTPTPVELRYFSAQLVVDAPDVRSTVRAVVSSREYFEQ